jgi:prepilin-type N-terminal cleavage/methylation domain-containing protein
MLNKLNLVWRKFLSQGANQKLDREGFTLIEILMVMMILSIGILPVAVIQHRGRQQVVKADLYTKGIMIASSQLERAKGMGFGNAVADSGYSGNVGWTLQVNNVSFGLDRLTVTSSWQDGADTQTLTVTDLVSMR